MNISSHAEAQLALIGELFTECERRGVYIWLFGGWGVDALLGRITRDHNDIDLLVETGSREALREVLEQVGGRISDHNMGWRYEKNGVRAEICFILHCPDGTPVLDVAEDDPNVYPWPPGSFPEERNGCLPGFSCRAISWEAEYVAKAGYFVCFPDRPLREKDRQDLEMISRHVSEQRRRELEDRWFPGIPKTDGPASEKDG